jgi:hypothetical protein
MTMRRVLVRTVTAAAFGVAVLALPAAGSEGGGKGHGPSIQSTAFGSGENQSTTVEAGVVRAKKVTLTVGKREDRDRFELERGDRESGVTFWTTEVPDREEKCAPVEFVAKNAAGRDVRQSRVCTFGPSEPEEPGGPLPVP